MGSISQSFEVPHTPLCMSDRTHALNNFRPTDALMWAVAEPSVYMLPLEVPKAPTALIFLLLLSISDTFACSLRLAFLVGDKIIRQQRIHDTHNLCLVLALSKGRKVLLRPTNPCQGNCNKEGPSLLCISS